MTIVFATSNQHKIQEINQILEGDIQIIPMSEAGYSGDLEESQSTIKGNAQQKVTVLEDILDVDCFAEDTGLEIEALDGRPGVMTARYGGTERDSQKNINRVLKELEGKENRGARFKTVIALIMDGATYFFEGVVHGKIIEEQRGSGGFGYDPIFVPDGYDQTFAELSSTIKNKISHRAIATEKLVSFLRRYSKCKNPE